MKKAYFLLASALVGVASAGAAEQFFSPEGAGSKDGTSWENAADGSTLAAKVKAAKAGDGFYLRAGTYTPGTLTVPAGVSIRGGYGEAYSGTETHIAYPSPDETILSADTDGNGVGDNAAKAFITLSYSALPSNSEAVVLAGLTVRDAVYTGTSNYAGSAVYGKNANAEFDHVRFIANSRNTGGGAVTLLASQTYFH
ncbi:MAG: hypothetical protein K2F91_00970, partial [Muribaculaceae bacterium]|nr:hypothetical protein [Muribaculaceae bacterium]